jgi:hypothetical protein
MLDVASRGDALVTILRQFETTFDNFPKNLAAKDFG